MQPFFHTLLAALIALTLYMAYSCIVLNTCNGVLSSAPEYVRFTRYVTINLNGFIPAKHLRRTKKDKAEIADLNPLLAQYQVAGPSHEDPQTQAIVRPTNFCTMAAGCLPTRVEGAAYCEEEQHTRPGDHREQGTIPSARPLLQPVSDGIGQHPFHARHLA